MSVAQRTHQPGDTLQFSRAVLNGAARDSDREKSVSIWHGPAIEEG